MEKSEGERKGALPGKAPQCFNRSFASDYSVVDCPLIWMSESPGY
jgi:hypothetical protein